VGEIAGRITGASHAGRGLFRELAITRVSASQTVEVGARRAGTSLAVGSIRVRSGTIEAIPLPGSAETSGVDIRSADGLSGVDTCSADGLSGVDICSADGISGLNTTSDDGTSGGKTDTYVGYSTYDDCLLVAWTLTPRRLRQ